MELTSCACASNWVVVCGQPTHSSDRVDSKHWMCHILSIFCEGEQLFGPYIKCNLHRGILLLAQAFISLVYYDHPTGHGMHNCRAQNIYFFLDITKPCTVQLAVCHTWTEGSIGFSLVLKSMVQWPWLQQSRSVLQHPGLPTDEYTLC